MRKTSLRIIFFYYSLKSTINKPASVIITGGTAPFTIDIDKSVDVIEDFKIED